MNFFSCDWGTSTFRLKLVNAESLITLAEIKTGHGIAATFENWKQSNRDEKERSAFYQAYLFEQVNKINSTITDTVNNGLIILSGMASSSIGMVELPYKKIPFNCDGSDLDVHTVETTGTHPYKIMMISGARSEADAVRGEETMLIGCDISGDDTEKLFIFPGTHSKHMIVKDGLVKNIKTYMTGELFDLLSNKSILSASVKKNEPEQNKSNLFFVDGVAEGISGTLSNSIFHVRTNSLFKKATPWENYDYLSGLLIGHELKNIAEDMPAAVTLVCSEGLKKGYELAFDTLGLSDRLQHKNADEALIKGQWKIGGGNT